MAKDYKNRVPRAKQHSRQNIGVWKWILITALIIFFVVFLAYLRMMGSASDAPSVAVTDNKSAKNEPQKNESAHAPQSKVENKPKPPHFEFYTILPEKEVVVPEYEIKTRTREERVGKAKENQYIMQAGSFKTFVEADQLRAKLALMGIESKVEKAKVGAVTWHRVKMGPFEQMASVNTIRTRLRKNGVDVIVTEVGPKPTPTMQVIPQQ